MILTDRDDLRVAILTTLVERSPIPPGRTALMKYAYLLQKVRRVPLGYRFHLYNYGPYDSSVLADVRRAEAMELVNSELVTFTNGGFGYRFSLGRSFPTYKNERGDAIRFYSDDVDWVLKQFGDESASRLELISTIMFAMCDSRRRLDRPEVIGRVHEIKPHFSTSTIEQTYDEISEVLDCVGCHDDDE
jgi:uncharacterized protein YwgA